VIKIQNKDGNKDLFSRTRTYDIIVSSVCRSVSLFRNHTYLL